MKKETGGPAFPALHRPDLHGDFKGMTLRDYFAGKAMAAIIANETLLNVITKNADKDGIQVESLVSGMALSFADAMLKGRDK